MNQTTLRRETQMLTDLRIFSVAVSLTAALLGGCTSQSVRDEQAGRAPAVSQCPSCLLQEYVSSCTEQPFIEYWMDRAVGTQGVATIISDIRDGSFSVISRVVQDGESIRYDIYTREHREEEIQHRAFLMRYNNRDRADQFLRDIKEIIDSIGDDHGLVVSGGPILKNHMSIESGRNIFVPFSGLPSSHYKSLELAGYGSVGSRQESPTMGLSQSGVELLINELDVHGEIVPLNLNGCSCE